MPAIFVQNEDGSESLLNFNVQSGEVIIHRVANRFVLRRGKLQGCVVNRSLTGSGHELQSGTVAPDVERATRGPVP
jgi:type IV secretion system protein VirB9